MTILYLVVGIGVLILVHEFGHFWVARRVGVTVERFSIGFGPKIFGFKQGGTDFWIAPIPLGGYVKLKGEDPEEAKASEEPDSFRNKSVTRRAAIIVAGVVMNFLLAFVLMPVVFMMGQKIPEFLTKAPVVEAVMPDTPASRAGLASGDRALKITGESVAHWEAMITRVQESAGFSLVFTLQRGEEIFERTLVPEYSRDNERWLIGVQMPASTVPILKKYPFTEAVKAGFEENIRLIGMTFGMVKKLVTLQASYKAVGGPVQIASYLAKAAASGMADFLYFIAFLSINLAVLNILPFPLLDGGHLMFLAIEGIRRKPVSLKVQLIAQQIGLVLLLTFVALVTIQDVNRLWNISEWIRKVWP